MPLPDDSESNKLFTLWCNGKEHQYPVDTFARVSKKCAALVKSGHYQGKITMPIQEETFEAFENACQLQPFKVVPTNAYELLDLSQEWGIPSLETFVTNYIEKQGIKKRDLGDPLAELLDLIEAETKNPKLIHDPDHVLMLRTAIEGVAQLFNQYLTDERLSQVHPEILFQVMMQAEEHDRINQPLFIEFVMKLFEADPEKAVPLCLRIDFNELTDSQIEEIFQCREIHEESMGYFVAASMSAIRNKQEHELSQVGQKYEERMKDIKTDAVNNRAKTINAAQDKFNNSIQELEQLAESQQQQIDELKDIYQKQAKLLNDEDQRFEDEVARLQNQLSQIKAITSVRQKQVDDRLNLIKRLTDERKTPLVQDADAQLHQIQLDDDERRDKLNKSVPPVIEKIQKARETEQSRLQDIDAEVEKMHDLLSESFATLAAKILNDQFATNYFLRHVEGKFEIFNTDPRIWDLTADEVKKAEEIVHKLENRVRATCPINVHHSMCNGNCQHNKVNNS